MLILAVLLAFYHPRPTSADGCQQFSNFYQLAACERANGTLNTLNVPTLNWRVRYFFRYHEMPCGEFPTEQEAYVFQMATRDLYGDTDLNDYERQQIRVAMWQGYSQCER